MSSIGLTGVGTGDSSRLHDLIVTGVTCTEEIIAVPTLPALDSHGEIIIRGRWQSVGGNGLNVAVHAARLGADVSLISNIPTNIWPEVTASLKRSGVDRSRLVPDYVHPAPEVLLITDDNGEYSVFVSDRTGLAFTPAEVAQVTGLPARFVHIDGFTLGALSFETQVQAAQLWLDLASDSPVTLSIDLNRAICDDQPERVRQVILQADLLFANAYEAISVTGTASPEEAARTLVEWNVPAVVVKNGPAGIICSTDQGLHHLPTFELPVADTVGAGDGVVAGTLCGLMRGLKLRDAARLGAAVAALVCTGHGSQGASFEKADVYRLLESA